MKIVRIDKQRQATLTCPACHKAANLSVSYRMIRQKTSNITCKCGHSFPVQFDCRAFFRKKVRIPAKIYNGDEALGEGTILSISVNGLAFETRSLHRIYINQPFTIAFTLDDEREANIQEKIVVKRITGSMVGCDFCQEQYNHDLDFYLAPRLVYP
jgi:hypothetical protein